jgi:diaminopropionate ammonia-lyase
VQSDLDPRAFHRRLPEYTSTPLHDAPALAASLGLARVSIKDESNRLGLPSFKILGASWATSRLLTERLGHEPEWRNLDELRAALAPLGLLTFVTATDGNHGRAVARMAALLAYRARIFVPAGTAAARVDAIASEGATVTVVDGTYDDAVVAAAALAADDVLVISDTAWPGYTDVPRWVIDGYATIFAEIDEQLADADAPPLDLVLVPMGVGALAAATVEHAPSTATIVAVEPVDAACGLASKIAGHPVEVPGPHRSVMAGLNCGNVSIVAWPIIDQGIDAFVTVTDTAAEAAMRALAAVGITAGETGAASLAGLQTVAAHGPTVGTVPELAGKHALVLCTEGATDPVNYRRIVGRAPASGPNQDA